MVIMVNISAVCLGTLSGIMTDFSAINISVDRLPEERERVRKS